MMSESEEQSIAELIESIRKWLRYHSAYDVIINMWAAYGMITISLMRGREHVWSDSGINLDKRLYNVLVKMYSIHPYIEWIE
jgi:hypothetical protein